MIFPVSQRGGISYIRADQVSRLIHTPAGQGHSGVSTQIFLLDGRYEIVDDHPEVVKARWHEAFVAWLRATAMVAIPTGGEDAEWVEVKHS